VVKIIGNRLVIHKYIIAKSEQHCKQIRGCNINRVLATLQNLENSGNLLILENSGNLKFTQDNDAITNGECVIV